MLAKFNNVIGKSYIVKIENGIITFDFVKLAVFRPYTAQKQENFTKFIEELAAGFIRPVLLWSLTNPPPEGAGIIIRMQDDPSMLRFATVEPASMIRIVELNKVSWIRSDSGFYWMPMPAAIG